MKQSVAQVLTDDGEAKVAAQVTSVRMPTALNVVVGLNTLGEDPNAKAVLKRTIDDCIRPFVKKADSMHPVKWIQETVQEIVAGTCFTIAIVILIYTGRMKSVRKCACNLSLWK